MKARNAASNAVGSSSRNTRLNVSWLGVPCSSERNVPSTADSDAPNAAMSTHVSAPHSTAAKANEQHLRQLVPRVARTRVRHRREEQPKSGHRSVPDPCQGTSKNPFLAAPLGPIHHMRFPCPK